MSIQSLIDQFIRAQQQAKSANEARYQQLLNLASEVENLFGANYGAGAKAELERTKVRDVASSQQGLVSAGLGGTTRSAGLSKKWEEEVGVPARLNLEDVIAGKQFAAKQFKAGIIERRTDEYPDYNALMQAVAAAYSTPATASLRSSTNPYMSNLGGFSGASSEGHSSYPSSYSSYPSSYQSAQAASVAPTKTVLSPTAIKATPTVVKATPAEQTIITKRLQQMYPQMYDASGKLKAIYGG